MPPSEQQSLKVSATSGRKHTNTIVVQIVTIIIIIKIVVVTILTIVIILESYTVGR